jgi:hypothetical protein
VTISALLYFTILHVLLKSSLADAGVLSVEGLALLGHSLHFGYTEMINMDIVEFSEFLTIA